MLALAQVTSQDQVYDLGCGDGRLVIAAALRYGARGVGVDIEAHWVEESRRNARAAGVEPRVRFETHDALTFDISPASVIVLYLVHWSMQLIAPIIASQVGPGTRIVSLSFPVVAWDPDRIEIFKDADGLERTLYLWTHRNACVPLPPAYPQG
jgi:ribosomal protein L11 methylase PrmA